MDKPKRNLALVASLKAQFLHHFIFHLVIVIAFTCGLVCFYAYWFPSLCSVPIKQVVFLYIPYTCSSIFSPKGLFVVVNVIVIYLVGEWKFVRSKLSSEACEIYDEYVKRSRIISTTLQRRAGIGSQPDMSLVGEKRFSSVHEEEEKEEAKQDVYSSIEEDEEFQEVEEEPQEVVEEEDQCHHQEGEVAPEGEKEDGEKKERERDTEIGWAADEELNKRVEEFIARVNRQRWLEEARLLESRSLVCCFA